MKLYQADLSPFAARCRIQIYAKNLPVEMVDPPGGLGSAEYKAINPIGKIPTLEVDGKTIPESQIICEYLEECFPEPSLMPQDPLQRARVRLIARVVDLYFYPLQNSLMSQLNPATADPDVAKKSVEELDTRLDQLENLLDDSNYAIGDRLTLADCALFPPIYALNRLLPRVGGKRPVEGRPRLSVWWENIKKHEAVSRVYQEMTEAIKKFYSS